MNKAELVERLQQIPGNPEVLVKVNGEWEKAEAVIATGEHRNGITLYASDPAKIDYLGPVP